MRGNKRGYTTDELSDFWWSHHEEILLRLRERLSNPMVPLPQKKDGAPFLRPDGSITLDPPDFIEAYVFQCIYQEAQTVILSMLDALDQASRQSEPN